MNTQKQNIPFLLTLLTLLLGPLFSNGVLLAKADMQSYSAEFVVFSKDKSQLVYLQRKPRSEIIKTSLINGQLVKRVPFQPDARLIPFAATPDGFKLLAFSPKGIAVIHNGTGKVLRILPYPAKNIPYHYYARSVPSAFFVQSDDGVLLSIPNPHSKQIDLIHTGSGKLLHRISLLNNDRGIRDPELKGLGFNGKRNLIAYEVSSYQKHETVLFVYDLYKRQMVFNTVIDKPHTDPDTLQFSRNGKNIVLNSINGKDIKLVDLTEKKVKSLAFQYSCFVGFTPNDKDLIIVQPYQHSVSLWNRQTEKARRTAIIRGQYGWAVVQRADRSQLVLSIKSARPNELNQFVLIDARTGKQLRQFVVK